MSWEEKNSMLLREQYIFRIVNEGQSVTNVSKLFNISRKTAYKWINRYREDRAFGLEKARREINSSYRKSLKGRKSVFIYERRKQERKEKLTIEKRNRVKAALETLEKARSEKVINAKRNHKKVTEDDLKIVRASKTYPEVRRMKMGDSGFRLAYNVQFATGLDSRVIYGVDVVSTLDPGTPPRLMAQVQECLKSLNLKGIKRWIADTAYSARTDIITAAQLFPNCLYYAPPNPSIGVDPKKPRKKDCKAMLDWRERIGTEETNELYKNSCSTAEFSNMHVKNRKFVEFSVRGLVKARGMALLYAIAQNVARTMDLIKKKLKNPALQQKAAHIHTKIDMKYGFSTKFQEQTKKIYQQFC